MGSSRAADGSRSATVRTCQRQSAVGRRATDLFERGHALQHLVDAAMRRVCMPCRIASGLSSAVEAPWSTISFRPSVKRMTS